MDHESLRLTFGVTGNEVALLAADIVAMRSMPSIDATSDRPFYGIWVDLLSNDGALVYRRNYEDILTWDEEVVGLTDCTGDIPMAPGLSRRRPRQSDVSTSFDLVVPRIPGTHRLVLHARGTEYSFRLAQPNATSLAGTTSKDVQMPVRHTHILDQETTQ